MAKALQGRGAMFGAIAALVIAGGITVWYVTRPTEADDANSRIFICATCGKQFPHMLAKGETMPVQTPCSHGAAGYQAEECYWVKSKAAQGRTAYEAKLKPTYVLLNKYKGVTGPTVCPDCGREVVAHNADRNMPPRELRDRARQNSKG